MNQLIRGVIADGVRGAAEALFPTNDFGAPDWRDAEVVPRMLDYIEELPPHSRALVVALYTFLELGGRALAPTTQRFSRLPVSRRTELIRGWRSSKHMPLKVLGDGLKASLNMIYLSHPAVMEYIGVFKVCDNPDDPVRVPLRLDYFERGVDV